MLSGIINFHFGFEKETQLWWWWANILGSAKANPHS